MIGELQSSGTSIETTTGQRPLSLRSSSDVDIASGAGRHVMMRGGSIILDASRSVTLSGEGGEFEVGWNRDMTLASTGGSFSTGGLRLSGGTVESVDVNSGMHLVSARNVDVSSGLGRDVVIRSGGGVSLTAGGVMSLTGRRIALRTGWNNDMRGVPVGG